MNRLLSPRIVVITLLLISGVSFLLFHDFSKSGSRIIEELTSFGHLPLFGVVALVSFWVLSQAGRVYDPYFKSWLIACLTGVLTECIQLLIPYRHFRFSDMYTDVLGAAVFLTSLYITRNGFRYRHIVLLLYGLSLLVLMRAYPIFTVTVDEWNMKNSFPILNSFESPFEMSRLSGRYKAMDRVELHATQGTYSLKVTFNPGEFPGISVDHLQNDWRGYGSLSFDTFVAGYSPLEITVRVNDREHNNEYTDRFNKSFQILPGVNHVTIHLKDIMNAPKGRIMDMADITNIRIFAYRLKETRTVYFDNFRLEGSGSKLLPHHDRQRQRP